MKEALLFKTKVENGRPTLAGVVARTAVAIPFPADVLIFDGKVYILHYHGVHEVFYREATVHHFQKNAVMVDGQELKPKED